VCALSLGSAGEGGIVDDEPCMEGGEGRRGGLNQQDIVVVDHDVDRLRAKLPILELDLVATWRRSVPLVAST
jgi:hypothetical protein